MTLVVFAGPSVTPERVRQLLPSARCEAPARRGDVYRAERAGASVIALIDGYFDHALSVWHKEILWALSRGVLVYGAASMGALRAAELAHFGMQGVGEIYRRFAEGTLEDDDEVAVVHEPAEHGYRPRSEAMVNLRATLERAREAQLLSEESAGRLESELKRLFYPLRCVAALRSLCRSTLTEQDGSRFLDWLDRTGVVNQKALDAENLLRALASELETLARRRVPPETYQFAETDAWRTLRATIDAEGSLASVAPSAPLPARAPSSPPSPPDRVDPGRASRSIQLATERALRLVLARQSGSSPSEALLQAESEAFRRERGLLTPAETQAWLADHGLDLQGFSQLIHDNVLCRQFDPTARQAVEEQIPSALLLLDFLEKRRG